MKVFIRDLNNTEITTIVYNPDETKTFDDLRCLLKYDNDVSFTINGVNQNLQDQINKNQNIEIIEVNRIVVGGKGGFGSLLKGQPPVKKRTNNFDSCRDLSGRRIRHVNQEKQLRDWQAKKMEEDRLIKKYDNPVESVNINSYLDSENKKEVLEKNKKYIIEDIETINSVKNSIKFLMRKKKRCEENIEKNINEEISTINYGILKNNKLDIKNINLTKDLTITSDNRQTKEELEKEIFALDV